MQNGHWKIVKDGGSALVTSSINTTERSAKDNLRAKKAGTDYQHANDMLLAMGPDH